MRKLESWVAVSWLAPWDVEGDSYLGELDGNRFRRTRFGEMFLTLARQCDEDTKANKRPIESGEEV